jgi:hypothetical protein
MMVKSSANRILIIFLVIKLLNYRETGLIQGKLQEGLSQTGYRMTRYMEFFTKHNDAISKNS